MATKDNHSDQSTYADAGVDIDAGNALVERIKPLAGATQRKGVMDSIGGFGGLFDLKATHYKDPVLVAATDGVGTKLELAAIAEDHTTIGIDLVAMCVNDLVVQGAEPLFFLDYFACGTLSVDQAAAVVQGVSDGCRQAGCALVGGETAEMPGLYQPGTYDLAGFSVGAVERDGILPKKAALKEGDVLLGLTSSGIHSNGFSLVRHVMKKNSIDYLGPAPFDNNRQMVDCLLTPTRIYVKSCLDAIAQGGVKALAHITGGGLSENIPRVLPNHLGAHIQLDNWELPAVFNWLAHTGHVAEEEMLRTFNCGIGMVIAVEPDKQASLTRLLENAGETVITLGEITPHDRHAVTYQGALL